MRCSPSIDIRPRSAQAACCSSPARSAGRQNGTPEPDTETLMKVMPDYWGEVPYPTLTGAGVNWLAGFKFKIKVVAKLPEGATA